MKNRTRHRLEQTGFALLALLINLAARLPMCCTRAIADVWAGIVMLATPRRQRLADENLAASFPDLTAAQRGKIRRASVRSICRTMSEMLKLPRLSERDLDELIEADDLSAIKAAHAEGHGIMLITAHYGNWELMAAYIARKLGPLMVVARDASHPVTAGLINHARESHGIGIVGRRDTREMLRTLSSGGILGMLPDQHAAEGGMLMDFLGRPAWTFTGPALLASRTGARVFAGFCVRRPGKPFKLDLLPEIELVNTGDREADIVTNTRLINSTIERAIREHPDNWLWLHNRWKQPRRLVQEA